MIVPANQERVAAIAPVARLPICSAGHRQKPSRLQLEAAASRAFCSTKLVSGMSPAALDAKL